MVFGKVLAQYNEKKNDHDVDDDKIRICLVPMISIQEKTDKKKENNKKK